jgi:hypothetical protein
MAILHPQECYLLEQFSSAEHIAATRDAIIAFIDAHEAAYARYLSEIPVRSRSEPLWKQADVVWGNRYCRISVPPVSSTSMHIFTELMTIR